MTKFIKQASVIDAFGGFVIVDEETKCVRPAKTLSYYESRSGLTKGVSMVEEGAIHAYREDSLPENIYSLPDVFAVFPVDCHGAALDNVWLTLIKRDEIAPILRAWEDWRGHHAAKGDSEPETSGELNRIARRWSKRTMNGYPHFYLTWSEVVGSAQEMEVDDYGIATALVDAYVFSGTMGGPFKQEKLAQPTETYTPSQPDEDFVEVEEV